MDANKNIGVTSTFVDSVKALRSFDPQAPGSSEMSHAVGTRATDAASSYVDYLASLGSTFASSFQEYLAVIHADCDAISESVADMQNLDEEIAGVLRKVDTEVACDAPPTVERPIT